MTYRPYEFAKLVGKSTSTLRRWDREGKLVPSRSVGGQRYYTEQDLATALNLESASVDRKTKVYCRVSSNGQKPELANQVKAMETYCLNAGITVDEWVQEIGGGLNFKRKKFLKLMKEIRTGEVETIIVAHKDRLCRFGFDFIEEYASWFGASVVVVNQESLSPQAELVEDLLAIVHTFSCRIYGMRSYEKQIKSCITSVLDGRLG